MINNNTQVSPRNGVDFSRIRKAQIPKFAIGGITHQKGDWYNTIFSSFKLQMMQDLAAAKTPEEKKAIINKYNNLQTAYGKLRPLFTDLSSVDFNQSVKDYLDLINDSFSFVNTGGINNGVTSDRYKKIGSTKRIGKDLSDKWESDGYWGGQTQDRTTLGYKGDWDENSNEFKTWQDSLKELGMETYLDSDNTYKLRLLSATPPTEITQPTPTEQPAPITNSDVVDENPWEAVEYPVEPGQLKKFRFPTFPLYNAALLGVANLTNKRIFDIQSLPLNRKFVFTPRYAELENGYQLRSDNNAALNEYKWDINLRIDNVADLGQADAAYRDARGKELDTKLANNQIKSLRFDESKAKVLDTANYNKAGWDQSANTNNAYHVAEAQRLMNNRAQYEAQKGQNLQENIMANYNDWKAWNRNNQLLDYADWRNREMAKVQNDLNQAWEDYQGSNNLENYQGYKDFWNGMYENGLLRDNGFARGYANYLGENGVDNAANKLKYFLENYTNPEYTSELGSFDTDWKKYQSDAMQNYVKNRNAILTRWGLLDARSKPINFDGEVSSWLYNRMNPRGSYQSIYMKKGGRFLEYLEHNRKAEKDIRDTTMKSMSDSRKMLKRNLDALDRESLLLLRAIFK